MAATPCDRDYAGRMRVSGSVAECSLTDVLASVDHDAVGARLHSLIAELYPICRSITGDGVRRTLARIGEEIPLTVEEVPTGTEVLDWTVPREWNIRDAWVKGQSGERVIDFNDSNLHVLSYSMPFAGRVRREELDRHLFSLPEHPDWIPYRTSYYDEAWGFCVSHTQRLALREPEYEVVIDSSLEDGSLTYAECLLEGDLHDEVLVSCHVCHPSLCNDNLSGIAVATALARTLAEARRRFSYRFLFIPGTIGSITWLARNEAHLDRVKHGLVLTCVGDGGRSTYKRSRRGDAEVDRAMAHVLRHSGQDHELLDFSPWGYDERQYCSPGFDLPVGCLMRTPHGRFPEYHTSADDLDLVRPEALADSYAKCLRLFDVLERNRTYLNTTPKGEPQLGRRGLYQAVGGQVDREAVQMAMLWVLNQSDGSKDLLEIATRSSLSYETIANAAALLRDHGLLDEARR
jgi:aminopeptidase-like protein